MARTAEYSILGFLYQFLTTFNQVMEAEMDYRINLEGIIEDIEVIESKTTRAIQCKYHSGQSSFVLSTIYKPVLQMLEHYGKNPSSNISYVLWCYFPSEIAGNTRLLSIEELETMRKSKDVKLKKIIKALPSDDMDSEFLKRIVIKFGPSYEDSKSKAVTFLISQGFSKADSEELFLPNSIEYLAELSATRSLATRFVTKRELLKHLKSKKTTALTRWTRELISKDKLLKRFRNQLSSSLQVNSRIRCLLIDSDYVLTLLERETHVLTDFIKKYCSKPMLNEPIIIAIKGSAEVINDFWKMLFTSGIAVNRGIIGGDFDISAFTKEPLRKRNNPIEFSVRLCSYSDEFNLVYKRLKVEDIYLFSELIELDIKGVNIYRILPTEANELKYILNINTTL